MSFALATKNNLLDAFLDFYQLKKLKTNQKVIIFEFVWEKLLRIIKHFTDFPTIISTFD